MRSEAVSGWAAHMRPAFATFAHLCAARLAVSRSARRVILRTTLPLPFDRYCQRTANKIVGRS